MSIDYGSGGNANFSAPVMRIDDMNHGFKGVVYKAETRQATDFESGQPKWFHNRKLIVADNPPQGADPVLDYIFHIAVESGMGAFSKTDDNGDKLKTSAGRNVLEVRKITEEDVSVVFSGGWMTKACKSVRLNVGHRVTFKRTTPARDENGDRHTDVRCEIEILGTVDSPQPYKQPTAAVDYGDDPFDAPVAAAGERQDAPVAAGMPEPF